MKSLSDIAHLTVLRQVKSGQALTPKTDQTMVAPEQKEALSNHVFKMLLSFYGKSFLEKYASGTKFIPGVDVPIDDPRANQDRGISRTRSIWGQTLILYSMETISKALERCKREHVTWAPNLPEFQALCEACKPRAEVRRMTEEELQEAINKEAQQKHLRDEIRNRAALQRSAARGNPRASRALLPEKQQASPIEALQEALATALAANGMDEGQALRMVALKITPELIASWAKGNWNGL